MSESPVSHRRKRRGKGRAYLTDDEVRQRSRARLILPMGGKDQTHAGSGQSRSGPHGEDPSQGNGQERVTSAPLQPQLSCVPLQPFELGSDVRVRAAPHHIEPHRHSPPAVPSKPMPTNPILQAVSIKLEAAAKTAYSLRAGISEASQTQDAASLASWLIAELEALQTSLSCLSLDLALRAYLTPPPNAPSMVNGGRSTSWTTATDLVRQVPDSVPQDLEQLSGRSSVPLNTMNIANTRTSAPASVEVFAGSSQNNNDEASAVEFAEWMLDEVLQGFKRLKSRAPRTGTFSNTSISAPIRTAGSMQTIPPGSTLNLVNRVHDNMLQDLRRLSDRRFLPTDTVSNVDTYPTTSARPIFDRVLKNLKVPSHLPEMQYDMPTVRPGVLAIDEYQLGPHINASGGTDRNHIDQQELFGCLPTITDVHEACHSLINSTQAPIHEQSHSGSAQASLPAPPTTLVTETSVEMLKSSEEMEVEDDTDIWAGWPWWEEGMYTFS